ncbi:MAG TPA: tetratricopeptide repeat protein [Chitinophagaceae bacterium]|nr:tetratricopeptide repeat protein [Chitinophagaceae bacterium]MCC6635975.1 tetratricopeptide repeat protein [Chitinophagaceae bacterium]HMZ45574.1 tetratricopeptide repeat protein [Chitinophagaceae bacterium]HNF30253.1 tetratricopeptide repeat protein [Chitinophagaceae bacterium]HNJ59040.1 tetratricopeptide repeat protein [Chitinophagaceae bacterium]
MDKQTLITQYFENNLSKEALQQFNELLQTDKAFAEEVTFQQQLKAAIHLNKRQELKQQLQQYEQGKVGKINVRKWLYIAAAIIFIAGSGILVLVQKPDAKELYAAYYQPYPNTVQPIVRGNNDNEKNVFAAFNAYEKGQYETALTLFDELYTIHKKDYPILYKAICFLQLNQPNESIEILKQYNFTEYEFIVMGKWYLAMAYLKTGDKENAIPLVKYVSENENPFQDAAKTLFKKLNK